MYLYDFDDYNNLVRTYRVIRRCLASTLPSTILRLAAKSSETLFRTREDGSTKVLRANRPADPDSAYVPRKGTRCIMCDNHRRPWGLLSSTRWDEEWASTRERFG